MSFIRPEDKKDYDAHDWYEHIVDLIEDNKTDEVREVLLSGVEWYADYSYSEPLTVAVQAGNLSAVKMLMEEFGHDDSPEHDSPLAAYDTALDPEVLKTAIKFNRTSIVDYLIDDRKKDLDSAAWYAADNAARTGKDKDLEMLGHILKKGVTDTESLKKLVSREYYTYGSKVLLYFNAFK